MNSTAARSRAEAVAEIRGAEAFLLNAFNRTLQQLVDFFGPRHPNLLWATVL
ncbi:unnamed protein product [marine sediment metagenome]|uniref:Uncharacterized protein n=1 Tax=marine sediment metagenome TaxID=412755 RepID=X0U5F5_9ZZZZ